MWAMPQTKFLWYCILSHIVSLYKKFEQFQNCFIILKAMLHALIHNRLMSSSAWSLRSFLIGSNGYCTTNPPYGGNHREMTMKPTQYMPCTKIVDLIPNSSPQQQLLILRASRQCTLCSCCWNMDSSCNRISGSTTITSRHAAEAAMTNSIAAWPHIVATVPSTAKLSQQYIS